jgi:ketosteroid isomerase-like protein
VAAGVLVYARHRGTGRDSGLPFDQELGDVLTLREGRIVTWMAYAPAILGR